jgi:hypothetical protein
LITRLRIVTQTESRGSRSLRTKVAVHGKAGVYQDLGGKGQQPEPAQYGSQATNSGADY